DVDLPAHCFRFRLRIRGFGNRVCAARDERYDIRRRAVRACSLDLSVGVSAFHRDKITTRAGVRQSGRRLRKKLKGDVSARQAACSTADGPGTPPKRL